MRPSLLAMVLLLPVVLLVVNVPVPVLSNGPDLTYRLSVTDIAAASGLAHVRLVSSAFAAQDSVSLVMHKTTAGWYDPIEVRNFAAFGDGHNLTFTYQINEEKKQTWKILSNRAKNLTVEYDVYLRYFEPSAGGGYLGYLGPKFLLSWAGWIFLLPASYAGRIGITFDIPSSWTVAVPWQKSGDTYLVSAGDDFAKSTVGLGSFEIRTSLVGTTELTVAVHQSWSPKDREKTYQYASDAYGYVASLFGAPGPSRYLAVYVPRTEDGQGVILIEAYDSQGEAHQGFGIDLMYGFVHRVFHTFNAFPPTGMGFHGGAEQWFSEGCNVYYDSKIPFLLNYWSDLNWMKYYLSEYESKYGTTDDAPVSSAGDYFTPQSFDRASYLAYQKGALVNFLLDNVIQRFSSGSGSLDNLLRKMYSLYGSRKGSYSNGNIEALGSSIARHDLSKFFNLYVYGNQRLPLYPARPLGIAVDWQQVEEDLGPLPQQILTTESTISSLSNMMFQIDGSRSDWAEVQPIIENPEGTSKLGTSGTNLRAIYAVTDANYLYVMIETWGSPDPGNNYVFPVDVNEDGDWDYSFGFNANYAWWYDVRTVPNDKWTQEMALDATYAVGDIAEIAIPMQMMDNPTTIDMLVWIYYPSLKTTVDHTGWGTVGSATSSVTMTAPTTERQVSTTAITGTRTELVPTQSVTGVVSLETLAIGGVVVVVIVAVGVLLLSRRGKFSTSGDMETVTRCHGQSGWQSAS